jgi:hypothetical protein
VPPVVSAALVPSAGGRRRARYTFALGLRSSDGTSRGWVWCHLGTVRMPCAGTRVTGAGGVPEASAETVLLSAECRHLAGEVVDLLQNCGVVGWTNGSERRLGCHLGDAVRTAGCGVQAALLLTGENGLYIGG